ncbi:MAG: hypothetical protein HDR54_02695 [Treponema sp.]|nr:hypothetical protein [Treponema sp.]MBD5410103.1 hypothetical protein [Treponema sp.]
MKIKAVAITLVFSLFINLFPCFSDTANTTPEPYKEDEFPSWLSDLRRAEIITLGAMPFVVLDVELAYSLGTFAAHGFNTEYFKNPFASSSENAYTTEEQKNLLLISLGICLGIGITDFIVNRVKNSRRAKRALAQQNKNIQIEPISENPDATLIPPPNRDRKRGKKKSKETVQVQKVEEQTERDGTDISTDEIIDENPMEVETWVDE